MKFYDISPDLVGCIRLCSFLVVVCTAYSLIQLIIQKQKARFIIGAFAMLTVDYLFFHLQLAVSKRIDEKWSLIPSPLQSTNLLLIITVLSVLIVLSLLILRYCIKWGKTHLTVMSVKDSLDNLPVGICYCDTDGKVLLINHRMQEFINEIKVKKGYHPIEKYGELKKSANTDPIEEMADGSIVILRKNEIYTEKNKFVEYLALDITKKYQLTKELEIENKKLKDRGKELREQSKTIDDVILGREILDTKIKVHNNFGQLLLASKYVLTHETDEKTKTELISKWKRISALRQEDNNTQGMSSIDEINQAAKAIGVEIIYEKNIPDNLNPEHINILEHILHEALTNSFSHARADKLFVLIDETENEIEIIITNNGIKPENEIVEGGGLSSLRKLIENKRGEMKIISAPEFKLKASLKK